MDFSSSKIEPASPQSPGLKDDPPAARRLRMVDQQIMTRGIKDARVLDVMRCLPRENFVPADRANDAYDDRAMPVGLGQTISQPYIVAYMTEALGIEPHHRVLEIGTGTGYQTAVLAMLARHVLTIERLPELSELAAARLAELKLTNVAFKVADGTVGWPDEAPFDRIIVTAAAPGIISALVDQLADGGRLLAPIGDEPQQRLTLIEKVKGRLIERPLIGVRFVRLIGQAAYDE
ncbi:MAG: protein-L-isoaspartate(D-aspartate) O-methyltransferase [Planctomycetia bacterium]|nr:protein-L-isoaspartate(D-aspartate) O-methyltransferase [Planctomycetia bacterium]MCC7313559.1 protein-L-isoaspartate(D-aspartate) O-methyltransferase [Planctomycetota bacterium]